MRDGMNFWVIRSVAAAFLLLLGWGLSFALGRFGLGWVGWSIAGGLAGLSAIELALRELRRVADDRRSDRWQAAMVDDDQRPAAIEEVRAELARAHEPMERARVAIILADLLCAASDHAAAITVLGQLSIETLGGTRAGVVRCARARVYLRAGELVHAESALRVIDRTGVAILDDSVALLRASLSMARGQDASSEAKRLSSIGELAEEALPLEAACLEKAGDREGARRVLTGLDDVALKRARLLAPPVVREALERLA